MTKDIVKQLALAMDAEILKRLNEFFLISDVTLENHQIYLDKLDALGFEIYREMTFDEPDIDVNFVDIHQQIIRWRITIRLKEAHA